MGCQRAVAQQERDDHELADDDSDDHETQCDVRPGERVDVEPVEQLRDDDRVLVLEVEEPAEVEAPALVQEPREHEPSSR